MYKLLLCLRYLKTRYIALASIISVTLGVATMIVVNSVMAGFSTEMRDRIHGILADVIIETNSMDGMPDPEKQLALVDKVAGEYIEGMTATVEIYGMLSFNHQGHWLTRPVTIIGIDPEGKAKVGPLRSYLDSFNVVRDGKTIVRQPLRKPNEVPSWNLTEDAMKYRKSQHGGTAAFDHSSGEFFPGDTPTVNDETTGPQIPNFNPEPKQTVEVPPFAQETETVVPPFAETEATPTLASPPPPPLPEDPQPEGTGHTVPPFDTEAPQTAEVPDFENQEPVNPDIFNQPGTAVEDVDPAAPLKGRVYIGKGLVSFPIENKKTGKVETIMMVKPGDDVKLSTITANRPPNPVHFNATVVDLFKSGMSEYDSNLVFCNLEYLQEVRGMIDPKSGVKSVTVIQLKLKDYAHADEVVKRLRSAGAFPPGMFTVRTWEQKQGPLLAAVEVEAAILNVLLFLIIAVAGFGILAIFYMIVVEKTRDIGILKALGAGSGGVMSIFLSYGLALGIVGSGVGVALGLLFVANINTIEGWITFITGRKVFDEKIYYFPEIPTAVNPMMVFWVAFGALAIAVLASILPARRASRLHPVESLRYE